MEELFTAVKREARQQIGFKAYSLSRQAVETEADLNESWFDPFYNKNGENTCHVILDQNGV